MLDPIQPGQERQPPEDDPPFEEDDVLPPEGADEIDETPVTQPPSNPIEPNPGDTPDWVRHTADQDHKTLRASHQTTDLVGFLLCRKRDTNYP
jgi:hypothetical protein